MLSRRAGLPATAGLSCYTPRVYNALVEADAVGISIRGNDRASRRRNFGRSSTISSSFVDTIPSRDRGGTDAWTSCDCIIRAMLSFAR